MSVKRIVIGGAQGQQQPQVLVLPERMPLERGLLALELSRLCAEVEVQAREIRLDEAADGIQQMLLEADSDIEVVGAAADANEARRMIREVSPDVITLDIEMPGMNGLEFLDKIMTLRPMPVIIVSSLTSKGADTTMQALQLGTNVFGLP